MDKISDLEIAKVSNVTKKDKDGDRFIETTITLKTDSLAPRMAARLQELGSVGDVEITIAPMLGGMPKAAPKPEETVVSEGSGDGKDLPNLGAGSQAEAAAREREAAESVPV